MRLSSTSIAGVHVIDLVPRFDERGYFVRVWDQKIFAEAQLPSRFEQVSQSYSQTLGTLRGLHWQAEPGEETKIVRCLRGRIFDVVVDLRPNSENFGRWISFELSAEDYRAIFIPRQCAHGFLTLEEHTEVIYQMSSSYKPELARTLRWDDPTLSIPWPIAPRCISQKDYECKNELSSLLRDNC